MTSKKPILANDINVTGDFIAGDQYNLFVQHIGAFTPPTDLAHLERSHRALDFKGIPQLRNITSELSLEEVYVPLLARPEILDGETWERRWRAEACMASSTGPKLNIIQPRATLGTGRQV